MISAILGMGYCQGRFGFTMAVLIGGYAILKIRQGFNR